jgi:hypothetical protein
MHEYRIFLIDENGRIARLATILECLDDQTAVAQAQQQPNGTRRRSLEWGCFCTGEREILPDFG